MPSMMNLEGPLSKWTNIINGWQFRWFVLDAETGLLSYFTTKENMTKGERRGCIRLQEAFVGYDNEDDITFTITVGDKTFHLQARNQDEREEWVSKIERAIRLRSTSNKRGLASEAAATNSAKTANAYSHKRKNSQFSNSSNIIQKFNHEFENAAAAAAATSSSSNDADHQQQFSMKKVDSNLTESDSYLQLLIEQLKELEEKRSRLMREKNNISSSRSLAESKSHSQSHSMLNKSLNQQQSQTASANNDSNSNLNGSSQTGKLSISENSINSLHKKQQSVADESQQHQPLNVSNNNNNNNNEDDQETNENRMTTNQCEEEENSNLFSIISSTQNLIETMKHAIVCLQIAKANSDPSKGGLHTTNELREILISFNDNNNSLVKKSAAAAAATESNCSSAVSGRKVEQHSLLPPSSTQQQSSGSSSASSNKSSTCNAKEKQKEEDVAALQAAAGNIKKQQQHRSSKHKLKLKNHLIPIASYSSSDEERERKEAGNNNNDESRSSDEDGDEFEYFERENSDDDNDDDDENDNHDLNDDDESFYDAIDQQTIQSSDSRDATAAAAATSSSTSVIQFSSSEIINSMTAQENGDNKGLKLASSISGANSSTITTAIQTAIATSAASAASSSHTNIHNSSNFDLMLLNDDEEYQEDELDINNQQSVITHLLTQVRIGMDLTKITLPTFILERRSLLEMYADFFAHTDLFLEIPSIKNPLDRMIQVVKWYLSTFHAGRKSPVAKKPYNPILGEVFQCWYNVPSNNNGEQQQEQQGGEQQEDDKSPVTDGPVPWATRDQLTFIAEQVSHHPPISAFYAEHYNKRIQVDGYTWTKSKFLGLSIGVNMVGKAVLSLLDLDEEYVATFPSAYGRSILTVPWFEMGGQVSVVCNKTGYVANIEFLTKPFYGGKKHQIVGTIMGPDKKSVCTIEGAWNGAMTIKYDRNYPEYFLNPTLVPTYKKLLRPLTEQEDFESRKLWREVTYHLRTKQIDLATSAKQRIEQRQRDDVKDRKEKNQKWQTRHFEEKGENWIYVKPLIKRLQKQQQQQQQQQESFSYS